VGSRDRKSRRILAGVGLVLALAFASVLPPPAPQAQGPAPRGPEGIWQASIMGIRVVVHIGRGAVGGLTGTLDSPDQGLTGLAIDTLSFAGDSLRLELRRLGAGFAGAMAASGDSIAGLWSQGGFSLPMVFQRLDRAPSRRRPQDPAPPYPYDTLDVVYDNAKAGVKLAGTLTTPRGKGPFPCALLITGSGPEDRNEEVFNHRPFWVLADHLTRQGIAVLRVDDRGVGGSTGDAATATSEDFAGDVRAGIEFLKGRSEIDRGRIGLIGHSEGGLIAPMVAARSRDVAFIVLLAGPGIRGDSILVAQTVALRQILGVGEAAIAREAEAAWRVHAMVQRGDSLGLIRAARELVAIQTEGLGEEQRRALGDLDALAARAVRQLLSPWMRFFVGHDPRPALLAVRCPVLALNGSKDLQVPAKENLAAIRQTLAAGGNRDVTVKELAGLNHLFQTATTGSLAEYGMIAETMAPPALEEISAWIVARFGTKR
jgi:hypothetical protein